MKTKLCIYSEPNYLTRTAIENVAMKRAEPILVYFYLLCNNKNYKKALRLLRAEPLSSYFEDRKGYRRGEQPTTFRGKESFI